MKSYVTEGTGSQQTLRDSQDNKIPVYATEADLDTDLENLPDGELALYPSEGASLSVPIDEVKSGDMHAVTSNAVAGIWLSGTLQAPISGSQTLNYVYNKLTKEIWIYGIATKDANVAVGNYGAYVAELPSIFGTPQGMYSTCACTGIAGSLQAKATARLGVSTTYPRHVTVKFDDVSYSNAYVDIRSIVELA